MPELHCQIVDPSDLARIHQHLSVAHAANVSQDPLQVYAAKRLHHGRRRSGQWWLGSVAGQPVTSLMCYRLALTGPGGGALAGFGLGAVATRPEARCQGYASKLCQAAATAAKAEGAGVGLLYSAIPSAFYERLGYRVCPAHNFSTDDPAEVAGSGSQARLTACDPLRRAEVLSAAYRSNLDGRLRVARDAARWRTSWSYFSDDWCFLIDGGPGYVRVVDDPEELELLELCPAEGASPQPALRAVAALTVALGRKRLVGWLEEGELAGSSFRDLGRARTLPMLSGVSEADAARARFFGSDHF